MGSPSSSPYHILCFLPEKNFPGHKTGEREAVAPIRFLARLQTSLRPLARRPGREKAPGFRPALSDQLSADACLDTLDSGYSLIHQRGHRSRLHQPSTQLWQRQRPQLIFEGQTVGVFTRINISCAHFDVSCGAALGVPSPLAIKHGDTAVISQEHGLAAHGAIRTSNFALDGSEGRQILQHGIFGKYFAMIGGSAIRSIKVAVLFNQLVLLVPERNRSSCRGWAELCRNRLRDPLHTLLSLHKRQWE